jgi:hypothetical protein
VHRSRKNVCFFSFAKWDIVSDRYRNTVKTHAKQQTRHPLAPETLHPREETLPQLLLVVGKMVVAASLSVRVERPGLVRQPARRLSCRRRQSPTRSQVAARCSGGRLAMWRAGVGDGRSGGGGMMVVNGGNRMGGGRGGGAGTLACVTAAAQALDEAKLHGFGGGLGGLLSHLRMTIGFSSVIYMAAEVKYIYIFLENLSPKLKRPAFLKVQAKNK